MRSAKYLKSLYDKWFFFIPHGVDDFIVSDFLINFIIIDLEHCIGPEYTGQLLLWDENLYKMRRPTTNENFTGIENGTCQEKFSV